MEMRPVKISSKKLITAFSQLTPNLAIGLAALAVPVITIIASTKFVSAPVESLVLLGVLGITSIVFAGWVVVQVIKNIKS